jgi:hypothetical protein
MMYNKSLVAAIKVGNKVLKEFDEKVYLPFGSEYEIYLKNLHASRRVRVEVEIDGSSGSKALVLNPKEEFTLDRFLTSANKLKFVERTENIEKHRGVRPCDGLVVLTYCFEEEQPQWALMTATCDSFSPWVKPLNYPPGVRGGTKGLTAQASYSSVQVNNTGITVPGGKSDQSFKDTSFRASSETATIVFQLLSMSSQEVTVVEPVLTKTKITCSTCGHKETAGAKFCSECGTSLVVYS